MNKSEFKFTYGITVDPVCDMVDTYMVQVDDHINEKTHILPNTYKNYEEAILAGDAYIKTQLDEELKAALA